MWKDFFYFSKTERQGIIVLVVLILGTCTISKVFSTHRAKEEMPLNDNTAFEKEYSDFIASIEEAKSNRTYSKDFHQTYSKQEVRLFPFDPNTADSVTLLSLGLPSWMVRNILRYRSKQGKFRRPEDFHKIYGLTEEQYQTLIPYIQISEKASEKDTVRLLTQQKDKNEYQVKYQPGIIIELNKVDTTELKKIPGIGSGYAKMIVNYRKQLGGFTDIKQLQEIHLKVEILRSWFSVDTNLISRINLNKVSLERMMYHPYINFYQAKVIVEYRKKKGKLSNLKQLSLYEEFTKEDLERISPYICFD